MNGVQQAKDLETKLVDNALAKLNEKGLAVPTQEQVGKEIDARNSKCARIMAALKRRSGWDWYCGPYNNRGGPITHNKTFLSANYSDMHDTHMTEIQAGVLTVLLGHDYQVPQSGLVFLESQLDDVLKQAQGE